MTAGVSHITQEKIPELRQDFINGNTEKLETIYRQYRMDIIKVVTSKNLCPEDQVEDHVSQSFIIFYENIVSGKVTEIKSIKNYLIGICFNQIRRMHNDKTNSQKKVEEIRLLIYEQDNYEMEGGYKEKLESTCFEAMRKLSEKCQKIIEAYYLDKASMKEISNSLNLSSSDVAKTLKSRCYKKLLQYIKLESNE